MKSKKLIITTGLLGFLFLTTSYVQPMGFYDDFVVEETFDIFPQTPAWFQYLNPITWGSWLFNKTGLNKLGSKTRQLPNYLNNKLNDKTEDFMLWWAERVKNVTNKACTPGGAIDNIRIDLTRQVNTATQDLLQGCATAAENTLLTSGIMTEDDQLSDVPNKVTKMIGEVGGAVNDQAEKTLEEAYAKYKKMALVTAGVALATGVTWYGSKALLHHIEKKLAYPKLISQPSRLSLLQRLKNIINPKCNIQIPAIFSSEVDAKLDRIIATTKHIKAEIQKGTGVTYRNLLLWGPSGSDKTFCARKLAQATGMDFVTINGSSFSKFNKGADLLALEEFFAWANRNTKGLLIFIDKAEAFLNPKTDYQLLTYFLQYMCMKSDKYMLVITTRSPSSLDRSIGSYIADSLEIPLPGEKERSKILGFYRDQILLDKKISTAALSVSIHEHLSDPQIDTIASKLENFSHDELKDIIHALRTDVAINHTVITEQLLDLVLSDAIKKHQQFSSKRL